MLIHRKDNGGVKVLRLGTLKRDAHVENTYYPMGGNNALYIKCNQNLSEAMHTSYSSLHTDFISLERAINVSIVDEV